MSSVTGVHNGCRSTIYNVIQNKEEAFESKLNLIKAQENEFLIYKEISKNEIKEDLPLHEKILTKIGSIFYRQNGERVFKMQEKQVDILDRLGKTLGECKKDALVSCVRGEVNRLEHTTIASLVKNPEAKARAKNKETFGADCEEYLKSPHLILDEKRMAISYSVLQGARRVAEEEVRREKILGAVVVLVGASSLS